VYQDRDVDWVKDACQDLGLLIRGLPRSRLLFITDSRELQHLTTEAFLLSGPPRLKDLKVSLKEACFTITYSVHCCIGKIMIATGSLASILIGLFHLLLDGLFLMPFFIFKVYHILVMLCSSSVQYFFSRSIRFIIYSFCIFSSTLSTVVASLCHFCLVVTFFLFILFLLDCRVALNFYPVAEISPPLL
jgi:hypothetical protein